MRFKSAFCDPRGRWAEWVLSLTDRVKISVKDPIQNVFCSYPTLTSKYHLILSKVGDLSFTVAMTAHCLGVLAQVHAIGHCVIGQERDLLWPDWLNWWACLWVPALEIQFFLTPENLELPGKCGVNIWFIRLDSQLDSTHQWWGGGLVPSKTKDVFLLTGPLATNFSEIESKWKHFYTKSRKWIWKYHLRLVPHICISELDHHCFRKWLVACSTPNHYPNQCWFIVNWTPGNKFQWNLNRNFISFIQENAFENVVCQYGGHFVQGEMS